MRTLTAASDIVELGYVPVYLLVLYLHVSALSCSLIMSVSSAGLFLMQPSYEGGSAAETTKDFCCGAEHSAFQFPASVDGSSLLPVLPVRS